MMMNTPAEESAGKNVPKLYFASTNLLKHIKHKHPECLPTEGRSLLSMGFTRIGGDVGRNNPELPADDVDDQFGLDRLSRDNADHDTTDFTARIAARHTPQVQPATAECYVRVLLWMSMQFFVF